MPHNKPELRKDYIQAKYVIIAPTRSKRPHDTKHDPFGKAREHDGKSCVFCPEKIDRQRSIMVVGKEKKWTLKVVPNKYPAISLSNPRAYGIQEVVIETPDHIKELEELPIHRIEKLLEVYAERTDFISRNPKIQYIIIFKNNGGVAGASLQHSHSQIFATDFIPPHLYDKALKTHAYTIKNGSCVYCDVIQKEIVGPRLVWQDKNIIVFTPYASLHNYEIWIMPKRHLDNITNLNQPERSSFAKALKSSLMSIDYLNLPYNYYFHQIINDTDQHLYMKIIPRGSVWAGVEIGSGIIINPITPEEAAEFYRSCFMGSCKIPT